MAQQELIFPIKADAPPLLFGVQGVPAFVHITLWFEQCGFAEQEEAWNGYALALLRGKPFMLDQLEELLDTDEWDTDIRIIVITWLAKNIRLPDNHVAFILLMIPDYEDEDDKSTDLFVEAIDAFTKIGMRWSVDQIEEIKPGYHGAKSVILRRMYQLRILDPTKHDIERHILRIRGTFMMDLLRVVIYDRQFAYPKLIHYVFGDDFFETMLPQLYHDNVLPVHYGDFSNYSKEPTFEMKYAMISNNVAWDIDILPFDDYKLKLEFKRKENRLVALCKKLPVEIVQKIAGMTGFRCLSGPMMLDRIIQRVTVEAD